MSKIIILVGISGSGKSTYAKKLWEYAPKRTVIINRDKIRELLFGFTESTIDKYYAREDIGRLEKQVSEYSHELITHSINKRMIVIVDNTNLKEEYLEGYVRYGCEKEIHFFHTRKGEAITKDTMRNRNVGERIINKQSQQFNSLCQNLDTKYYGVVYRRPGEVMVFPYPFTLDKIVQNTSLPTAIVVDIDGTIAKRGDRSPYDWKRVGEDECVENIAHTLFDLVLFTRLYLNKDKDTDTFNIILCSGRDEVCREETIEWLDSKKLDPCTKMYMRKHEDNRPDYIVKEEMWREISQDYNIAFLVDDRRQVIDHARALGLTVMDVANNTF